MTDSPWFWVYLFTTFGLIVMLLMLPKLEQRQRELDLEGQAKRVSMDLPAPNSNTDAALAQGTPRKRFSWLIGLLAVLLTGGWITFWFSRQRTFQRDTIEDNSHGAPTEELP